MADFLNARVYLMIGVFTTVICSLVVYFDTGGATAGFFTEIGNNARPFLGNGISNLIFYPLTQIFSDYIWAIGAGLAWPLVIVWLFMMFIGIIATVVGPTVTQVNNI